MEQHSRLKVLACKNTPLHGRQGGDLGVMECSELVAELEKMKMTSASIAASANASGAATCTNGKTQQDDESMMFLD